MKKLDRVNLIEQIGLQLQADMTTSDIVSYLGAFGIKTGPYQGAVQSKRLFVKGLLSGESDETIFQIADELEIDHPKTGVTVATTSKFWKANNFRLFISHTSANKEICSSLAASLSAFNISGFVAHVDIEPTREWQNEIEAALSSMDALLAVLTSDFVENRWCDQEVGIAIGRDVLVIPIRKGADPYGFIGKYQGFQSHKKTVREVAEAIFQIVVSNQRSRQKYLDMLLSHIANSGDEETITRIVGLFDQVEDVPIATIERLRENAAANQKAATGGPANDAVNALLKKYKVATITGQRTSNNSLDEDIPF